MSFSSTHLDPQIDGPRLEGLQCSIDVVRRALRADAAFLWADEGDACGLLLASGETDAQNAGSTVRDAALAGSRPVRHDDGSRAWLGVSVRLGTQRGVLCIAAPTPRAFDDEDVAMVAAVGALLATLVGRPQLPLQSLVDLSGTMLREVEAAPLPTDSLIAAANSLDAVAKRLRELSAPLPRPVTTAAGQQGAARILLADDLDLNRRLIADMLSLDGHRVDCVTDGAAAVRAVAAERYDLVLMDMIMPEMDGLAATRAIRALPCPARDVPIVALTANAMRDQLDSCLAAGMDAALTKPMSLEALNAAVAQWTRGRHAAA